MDGLRTLYVNRPLKNADQVIKWAKAQGFSKTLAADDLHVTVAYSKRPVDWSKATPRENTVTVTEGDRVVEALGATGDAIVLRFSSDRLAKRHQQFFNIGASWDWPEYKPHLTIAYKGEGEDIDISSIQPFDGDLVFGPEEFEPLDEDWKSKAVSAMDGQLKEMQQDRLALDRAASTRTIGADGHMTVRGSAVSKANVCEYLAEEIPGAESLGLTPGKRYRLYRDAASLEASAASLNGKPLMTVHRPQSASDHNHEIVIGALSNASWDAPYLRADLSFWDQEAIDLIESGEQEQISLAYFYKAVMTPGVSPEGEPYDGVMTNISHNHGAIVKKGRAGSDVVVGDSALPNETGGKADPHPLIGNNGHKEISMAKSVLSRKAAMIQGALVASVMPKLAQDAKVDFDTVLKGVTAKNYKAKKAGIIKAFEGKMAADADIEDVIELLDQLEAIEPAEIVEAATDPVVVDPTKKDEPVEDDDNAALLDYLKGVLSDEEYQKVCAMVAGDTPAAAMDDKDNPQIVTKTAMDSAIASAVKAASTAATANAIKTQSAIRDAERFVRPWVGDLAMSFDSAEGVYRHTLTALEVNVDGVHADALKPILEAQPVPGATPARKTIAMDSAGDKAYAERFPHANRLK